MESRAVKVSVALTLVFLYVPISIVVLYAFNDSVAQAWPIQEYTTKWFGIAWRSPQVREALANSLEVAIIATLFALVLGARRRSPCTASGSSVGTRSRSLRSCRSRCP